MLGIKDMPQDCICNSPRCTTRKSSYMDVVHSLNKVIYDLNEAKDYTKLKENYDHLRETIWECTRKSKKVSIERRVCLAILHLAVSKSDMNQLLKKYDFTFGSRSARKSVQDNYATLLEGKQLEKHILSSKASKASKATETTRW